MREYWLHINFAVMAKDEEEAAEIAHSLIEAAKKGKFRVESADLEEIEEA